MFDDLAARAASLARHGLRHPVTGVEIEVDHGTDCSGVFLQCGGRAGAHAQRICSPARRTRPNALSWQRSAEGGFAVLRFGDVGPDGQTAPAFGFPPACAFARGGLHAGAPSTTSAPGPGRGPLANWTPRARSTRPVTIAHGAPGSRRKAIAYRIHPESFPWSMHGRTDAGTQRVCWG